MTRTIRCNRRTTWNQLEKRTNYIKFIKGDFQLQIIIFQFGKIDKKVKQKQLSIAMVLVQEVKTSNSICVTTWNCTWTEQRESKERWKNGNISFFFFFPILIFTTLLSLRYKMLFLFSFFLASINRSIKTFHFALNRKFYLPCILKDRSRKKSEQLKDIFFLNLLLSFDYSNKIKFESFVQLRCLQFLII